MVAENGKEKMLSQTLGGKKECCCKSRCVDGFLLRWRVDPDWLRAPVRTRLAGLQENSAVVSGWVIVVVVNRRWNERVGQLRIYLKDLRSHRRKKERKRREGT